MEAVPSPCNKICTLDPDGRLCIGCGRTRDEIATWSTAGEDRRREIVERATLRLRPGSESQPAFDTT